MLDLNVKLLQKEKLDLQTCPYVAIITVKSDARQHKHCILLRVGASIFIVVGRKQNHTVRT